MRGFVGVIAGSCGEGILFTAWGLWWSCLTSFSLPVFPDFSCCCGRATGGSDSRCGGGLCGDFFVSGSPVYFWGGARGGVLWAKGCGVGVLVWFLGCFFFFFF